MIRKLFLSAICMAVGFVFIAGFAAAESSGKSTKKAKKKQTYSKQTLKQIKKCRASKSKHVRKWHCKVKDNKRGTKGISGINGPRGLIGPTGLQGLAGAMGLQGAKGDQGLQGDLGLQGTDGARGDDGADGAHGDNGADGADGAQGTDGAQGVPGADGTDGTDGAHGDDGTDGADGADGAPGEPGEQGPPGIVRIYTSQLSTSTDGPAGFRMPAYCQEGDVALGGGYSDVNGEVTRSKPFVNAQGRHGWEVYVSEPDTNQPAATTYVRCAEMTS